MPHETRQLSVPANDTGVREAQDALAALCAAHGLSKAVTWPVEVSLDEVLANVVHHGLGGRARRASGWRCASTRRPIRPCASWS
jgi:anti-sigma regulatory factor (Ser/Thr protein kinase)